VYQTIALLGAIAFALAAVLQQKGTLEAPAAENDPHFLLQILRKPVWLAGAGLLVVGWVLQAVALDKGPLMVVQGITSLSLVIALPFGIWLTNQLVRRREWLGAAATVVGIVEFLSVGAPASGTSQPSSTVWWVTGIAVTALVLGMARFGYRRSGAVKAALLGSAAGTAFAFQAAVTKVFVTVVSGGLSAILHSWSTYALIVSALLGGVLQQTALKSGILAPAMASTSAVTLFGSVLLGAVVFGETLPQGSGRSFAAVIGLVVALGGIAVLAGSAPPPPGVEPVETQAATT